MQIAIRRAYLPPNWEIICAIVLITKGQRHAATELLDNHHQKHTTLTIIHTHIVSSSEYLYRLDSCVNAEAQQRLRFIFPAAFLPD